MFEMQNTTPLAWKMNNNAPKILFSVCDCLFPTQFSYSRGSFPLPCIKSPKNMPQLVSVVESLSHHFELHFLDTHETPGKKHAQMLD